MLEKKGSKVEVPKHSSSATVWEAAVWIKLLASIWSLSCKQSLPRTTRLQAKIVFPGFESPKELVETNESLEALGPKLDLC